MEKTEISKRDELSDELYLMDETVTMFDTALSNLEGNPERYSDLLKCASAFCKLMKKSNSRLLKLL